MRQGRRVWFSLHSWIGLKLSVFLSFFFLSGAITVFSWELDWLTSPQMRVSPQAEEDRASWGALYDAARTAYPEGRVFALERLEDPWFAAQVEMVAPWGERFRMWINPYTAEVQGTTPWFNLHRFFRQFHSHLMLPSKFGLPLVTAFSFLVVAALVTGLLTYKKFWRGLFKMPRFRRSPRIWLGDLHRLCGVWSIWFLVVLGTTTLYYFAEQIGLDAGALPKGDRPVERSEIVPERLNGGNIDMAVAKALEEIPLLQIRKIAFPSRTGRSIAVQGHATATLVRPRANAVFIDPVTLEKLGSFRGEGLSVHQRISEAVDPLHFGTWGGLASRIVWSVFGLILFAMALLGASIYGQRALSTLTKGEVSES